MSDRRVSEDEYLEVVGREPPADPEHPLVEQWEYRGSREERARLLTQLGQDVADEIEAARGPQPEQEESLF